MSHSQLEHDIFSEAREWRRARAMIAAGVRHGHDIAGIREILPHCRSIGFFRAISRYAPGYFELGSEQADAFHEFMDSWGSAFTDAIAPPERQSHATH